MSYNVDHVECLCGELEVSAEGRAWVERDELDQEIEVDSCMPECPPEFEAPDPDGWAKIRHFWWSGEGSGVSASCGALEKFFSFTRGAADFIFFWEGGDSTSAYRVKDGKMVEHHVVMALGKPVKE